MLCVGGRGGRRASISKCFEGGRETSGFSCCVHHQKRPGRPACCPLLRFQIFNPDPGHVEPDKGATTLPEKPEAPHLVAFGTTQGNLMLPT